ncbi:MAG TPA: hypothetical protein VGB45_13840 [Abditibacterium sp.]|jgi:hypothetical protein
MHRVIGVVGWILAGLAIFSALLVIVIVPFTRQWAAIPGGLISCFISFCLGCAFIIIDYLREKLNETEEQLNHANQFLIILDDRIKKLEG